MKLKIHQVGLWVGVSCALVVFPALLYIVISSFTVYPVLKSTPGRKNLIQGAYHVHSTASDGRGTRDEIAQAASKAGLHFVVLTDHNVETIAPPEFIHGVLMISAVELSTPAGHVVALHLSRLVTTAEREHDVIKNISRLDGFSFLAHPIQDKRPWTDWMAAREANGLELYSLDSLFREAQRRPFSAFVPAILAYAGNSLHGIISIVKEQPEVLDRLLNLGGQAPKVALCAHDAHGWPSYETEFRSLAMALPADTRMPSDAQSAADVVISSLVSGRAYCVFRAIGDGDGFEILGLDAARRGRVGNIVAVHLPTWAPPDAQLRVHGPAHLVENGRSLSLDAPGALQLEVWVRVPGLFWTSPWRPWLVPSPIWIAL